MVDIIAHTMQYLEGEVESNIKLISYKDSYFDEYKFIYEECFREMRTALELKPVDCCDTREQLNDNRNKIFLLVEEAEVIGSVLINDNEIDDLIVSKKFQSKGYGKKILLWSINYMQEKQAESILLHVADWNKKAIKLYENYGFKIIKTEKV
ncbi:MAG: GNAT family N-acetyltransferase [Sarcina sp.]